MNTRVKMIGAAALAGAVSLAAAAPATAAPWWWHRHHVYHNYYAPAPWVGYYPYSYYNPGAAIAGGIIGGVFGTIAGAALSHSGGGGHVWRCEHHFQSYSRSSDTYLGFDGDRHVCRL